MRGQYDDSDKEALPAILRYTGKGQFERATETLVRTFQDDIYGYCFNRLGRNHTAAEEVAQKVFIAAWTALPKARFIYGEASIAPWLYAIAKYKIIDDSRTSPEIPVANPPEVIVEPGMLVLEDVKRALMKLDPKEKEVLIWRALEFSAKEIADVLGITPGGVRTRIKRARAALRRTLEKG